MGLKELRRLFERARRRSFLLSKTSRRFKFADAVFDSLGKGTTTLAASPGVLSMSVALDVVFAVVLALLPLNVLALIGLTPDTVRYQLVKYSCVKERDGKAFIVKDWSMPLIRSDGHLYAAIRISVLTFFTRPQIQKLHHSFCHPSMNKIFKLLKWACTEKVDDETLSTLRDIANCRDPCQRI